MVGKEDEFLKKNSPDLIVTDISPTALRLADKIKCSALCIGNFSWIYILKRMSYHDKKEHVLEWLKESFSYSEFAVKLSLSMMMEGFSKTKKSSLLCRDVTQDKNLVMKRLGLYHPFVLTYLENKKLNEREIKNIHKKNVIMISEKITINKKIILSYFEGQNLLLAQI